MEIILFETNMGNRRSSYKHLNEAFAIIGAVSAQKDIDARWTCT